MILGWPLADVCSSLHLTDNLKIGLYSVCRWVLVGESRNKISLNANTILAFRITVFVILATLQVWLVACKLGSLQKAFKALGRKPVCWVSNPATAKMCSSSTRKKIHYIYKSWILILAPEVASVLLSWEDSHLKVLLPAVLATVFAWRTYLISDGLVLAVIPFNCRRLDDRPL